MSHTNAHLRLSPRDERIVDCVYRFDAAWPELLRPFFPPLRSLSGVHKVLARLVCQGWLRQYRYQARRYYVTLGSRAVAHFADRGLELSPRRMQPLGPRQHPTSLFTLRHCLSGDRYRPRLTPQELADRWPAIAPADHRRAFYEQQARLVLVDIDLGGDAAYRARKWRRSLRRRRDQRSEFRVLTDAGRLQIAIITATPEQAEAITAELAEQTVAGRTTFAVCVDDQLLHWRAASRQSAPRQTATLPTRPGGPRHA